MDTRSERTPAIASRGACIGPVRGTAAAWAKAEALMLDYLEALGYAEPAAAARVLEALRPLGTYGLLAGFFQAPGTGLLLDCGPVGLRVEFLHGRTSISDEDLSLPFVHLEEDPDPVPVLTITTQRPFEEGPSFAHALSTAAEWGAIRVRFEVHADRAEIAEEPGHLDAEETTESIGDDDPPDTLPFEDHFPCEEDMP